MTPRDFGKFEIQEKLGAGGMGTVWLARDKVLGRLVALKFLAGSLATSPEARQRFLREARAASILNHPNIATVHEAGEFEEELYIAYEYIEGQTARQRGRDVAINLKDAVHIARGVARGLAAAHEKEVLHRDVTSGNVMVNTEGDGILVDFGLAKRPEGSELTATGVRVGTLAYMAPEVIKGEQVDARSDLYGLGVVLYEMVTGVLPYEATQIEALQYQVISGGAKDASEWVPQVPEKLDSIINKLLDVDPKRRYANAGELAEELEKLESSTAFATAIDSQESTGTIEYWKKTARRRLRHATQRIARVSLKAKIASLAIIFTGGYLLAANLFGLPPFPSNIAKIPVVAVLPFSNLSASAEESAHWEEGIGSELASRLGEVNGLRVLPWTTTMNYQPSGDPKTSAQQLGADMIVTGTYRLDGKLMECSLNLVDGSSGFLEMSKKFTQPLSEIIAMQRNMVVSIEEILVPEDIVTRSEQPRTGGTEDVEALNYYLLGTFSFREGGLIAAEEAIEYYEKALEVDPDYAEAYAGVGFVLSSQYFYGEAGHENLIRADENFKESLERNPDYSLAQAGLAKVRWQRGNTEKCLELGNSIASQASEIDIEAMLAQGTGYFFGGLAEKAVPIFEEILEHDPANMAARWYLAPAAAWAHLYPESIQFAEDFLSMYGDEQEMYTWIGFSHHALGNREEAIRNYEKALEISAYESNYYVNLFASQCYEQLGKEGEARDVLQYGLQGLDEILENYPTNLHMRLWRACYYAYLGESDRFYSEVQHIRDISGEYEFMVGANGQIALGYLRLGNFDEINSILETLDPGDSAYTALLVRLYIDIAFSEQLQKEPRFDLVLRKAEDLNTLVASQY